MAISVTIGGKRYLASHGDLPPVGCDRWTASRKLAVVAAVAAGLITMAEACRRYKVSEDELIGWMASIFNDGIEGVKVKHLHNRRAK